MHATRRSLLVGGLGNLVAGAARGQPVPPSEAKLPEGLIGEFHKGGGGRRPGLLVLGGSEGGLATASQGSRLFAAEGFSTLGLAYYRMPGLPAALENLPLEYFIRAVDWLSRQPSVDPRRIGVFGGSKGAEAALLLASYDRRIKAVVACAPSNAVWAGVDMTNQAHMLTIGSSWSWKGSPLPYIPYDFKGFKGGIRGLYDASYAKAPPQAAIAVEKINGPVLLLSGGKDEIWPSTPMSEAVMARLDRAGFRHKHIHLSYPDAGHGIIGPPAKPDPRLPLPKADSVWAMTQAARADSWPKTVAFLKEALDA